MFMDGILPVFFELRRIHPNSRFKIVLFTKDDLECLKINKDIWKALNDIKCEVEVHLQNKNIVSVTRYLMMIAGLAIRKTLVISSISKIPLEPYILPVIKKLNKAVIVRQFHHFTAPENLSNDVIYLEMWNKRVGKQWEFNGHQGFFDVLLSPITPNAYKHILKANIDTRLQMYTGFVHRLPEWRKFILQLADENPLIQKGKYIFYVLSHLGVSRSHLNEPDRSILLKETLQALKVLIPNVRIIFKPHPNLDVDEFKSVLKEIEFNHYDIDYSHPLVLASKAEFVVGNAFSTVMNDASFFGSIIVEYSCRDPEYYELLGKKSAGSASVDYFFHRDIKGFEKFIDDYLQGKIKKQIEQEKMLKNYPENPDSLYQFLRTGVISDKND